MRGTVLGAIAASWLLILSTAIAHATPVEYHAIATAGVQAGQPAHPILSDAQIELIFLADFAGLTPLVDGPNVISDSDTYWPYSTTQFSVKLTNANGYDGTYPAANYFGFTWRFADGADPEPFGFGAGLPDGDVIQFPHIEFAVADMNVHVSAEALLPANYLTGAPPHQGGPFAGDGVAWDFSTFIVGSPNPLHRAFLPAVNPSGFAVAVPEPNAIALIALSALGLTRLRRWCPTKCAGGRGAATMR
jgi:hypothetical protein